MRGVLPAGPASARMWFTSAPDRGGSVIGGASPGIVGQLPRVRGWVPRVPVQGRREARQPARRLDRGRRPGRPRSARPIAGGHCPSRALDGAPGLGRGARPGGRRRALWEVTSASHPRLPSVPSMMLGPSCPVGRYRRRLRCRCRSRRAIGVRFTGDRASRWRADAKPGNQPAARSAASTAARRASPAGGADAVRGPRSASGSPGPILRPGRDSTPGDGRAPALAAGRWIEGTAAARSAAPAPKTATPALGGVAQDSHRRFAGSRVPARRISCAVARDIRGLARVRCGRGARPRQPCPGVNVSRSPGPSTYSAGATFGGQRSRWLRSCRLLRRFYRPVRIKAWGTGPPGSSPATGGPPAAAAEDRRDRSSRRTSPPSSPRWVRRRRRGPPASLRAPRASPGGGTWFR